MKTDIYLDILNNDTRRLNLKAMKYFLRKKMYYEAAVCRDRVKSWTYEEFKKC